MSTLKSQKELLKEYLSNDYIHSFIVMMIIILFLLILKTILSSCSCATFIKEEALREAVYVLFREVVIVACGAIIVQAMNFYGVLALNKE